MKDVAAKFTAVMQGVGGSMASDEVVKGAMAATLSSISKFPPTGR